MVKLRQSQHGFTIIEVMIVLAIAGMILLVIFLAIPALSRSSRNNQRKQDVVAVLQAISHYELSNSANFPDPTKVAETLEGTKLYYYDLSQSQVTFSPQTNTAAVDKGPHTAADGAGNAPQDWVEIVNYAKCKQDGTGGTSKNGADYTNIVALYAIESSGGSAPKCEQL